jgi:hypothetical protein
LTDKWQSVVTAPIGSKANPLKDCAEAKVEFYVKGERESGEFFIVEDDEVVRVWCNLATGKKENLGQSQGSAAKSCKEILVKGGKANGTRISILLTTAGTLCTSCCSLFRGFRFMIEHTAIAS